jgi:hypothetical protein
MEAYRTRVHVNQDGSVTLADLPFGAGEEVEVIVLGEARSSQDVVRYPLRGTPLPYADPFEPVAQDDWEARAEVRRRVEELRSGAVPSIPGEQVFREIDEMLS